MKLCTHLIIILNKCCRMTRKLVVQILILTRKFSNVTETVHCIKWVFSFEQKKLCNTTEKSSSEKKNLPSEKIVNK